MPPAEIRETSSSPNTTSSSTGKRKRAESEENLEPNGTNVKDNRHLSANLNTTQLRTLMNDLLVVLKSYDGSNSILELPLLSSGEQYQPGTEPPAKRSKTSTSSANTTIASRIQANEYDSLEDLQSDVDTACTAVLAFKNSKVTRAKVVAFRKLVTDLANTGLPNSSKLNMTDGIVKSEDDGDSTPSQVAQSDPVDEQNGKMVLTLYGNAQGPKQLFSSLQQPIRVRSEKQGGTKPELAETSVTVPLREDGLPNLLTISKIIPTAGDGTASGTSRVPTFGEVFAPSPNIPQLTPPKPPKQSNTRGNQIGWINSQGLSRTGRKGFYPTQDMTTGHWLGYNNINVSQEPTSPTAKRKQRDRALSTGEARPVPSEEAVAALKQAKEDALFRTAFSSFAPTRDDSSAVIPERTKNQVWWQRYGEKRFIDTFALDPTLRDVTGLEGEVATLEDSGVKDGVDTFTLDPALQDSDLKDAVEAYTPLEEGDVFQENSDVEKDRETQEILDEISEMLETLHSYQHIRNSSLPNPARGATSQKPSFPWLAESPTTPSSAELDTYSILKDQLRIMIASLPPSAVAKLNGDQLEELNIKQTIPIEGQNFQGVMEEHPSARYAKAAALNATVGQSGVTRSSSGLGQVQYTSNSQYGRTPLAQAPSKSAQSTQGYFPQQQPPNRSPSTTFPQRTGSSQTYSTPTQAGTTRTSYPTSYTQSRPLQQSYGGGSSGQNYLSRSNSGNYNYNQQYGATTPASRQSNGVSYPPRPSGSMPTSYSTPATASYPRTSSPHGPTGASTAPRPVYSQYPNASSNASSVNGAATTPATPNMIAPPSSVVGPTGYCTHISNEQQQLIIDRQKAQLAMQTQARASATPGTVKAESTNQDTKVNGVAQ
ncbi:MAG: hypothetical protein M1820_008022 [Bogoriella megaspora]|nr:MAG: hypothetical protein M1820_008022 [Bogoriella megaspora]